MHQALTAYVNSVTASNNPVLEDQLGSDFIASSIQELGSQLSQTTPSAHNESGWAGYPEVVAMAHFLQQSILVLHLDNQLHIQNDSFMVSHNQLLPLSTLVDTIQATPTQATPTIQLILVDNHWLLIQTNISGFFPLNSYISGLSSSLQQLASGINTHEPLISINCPPCTVGRFEFLNKKNELINYHESMKNLISGSFQPSYIKGMYEYFQHTVSQLCSVLSCNFIHYIIGNRIDSYLRQNNLTLSDFLTFITSSRKSLSSQLYEVAPTSATFPAEQFTIWRNVIQATQKPDATRPNNFLLSHDSGQSTQEGTTNPEVIRVTTGQVRIQFQPSNSCFQLLSILNCIATSFSVDRLIFNKCRELQNEEGGVDQMLVAAITQCDTTLRRVMVLIHALMRGYFSNIYQLDHYQLMIIFDGNFVIFNSDYFQPRGGWQDLPPPIERNNTTE